MKTLDMDIAKDNFSTDNVAKLPNANANAIMITKALLNNTKTLQLINSQINLAPKSTTT